MHNVRLTRKAFQKFIDLIASAKLSSVKCFATQMMEGSFMSEGSRMDMEIMYKTG